MSWNMQHWHGRISCNFGRDQMNETEKHKAAVYKLFEIVERTAYGIYTELCHGFKMWSEWDLYPNHRCGFYQPEKKGDHATLTRALSLTACKAATPGYVCGYCVGEPVLLAPEITIQTAYDMGGLQNQFWSPYDVLALKTSALKNCQSQTTEEGLLHLSLCGDVHHWLGDAEFALLSKFGWDARLVGIWLAVPVFVAIHLSCLATLTIW